MGASSSKSDDDLIHVDTGDSLKVKQVLDETIVKAMRNKGYNEDHRIENLKVLLMSIACLFAMTAQFYPMPFPQSRPLLGVCCSGYFIFSGLLQLTVKFIERDCVIIAKPTDQGRRPVRISTTFPRYQSDYTIKLQYDDAKDGDEGGKAPSTEEAHCVGKFFDADGYLWEQGVMDTVIDMVDRFYKSE